MNIDEFRTKILEERARLNQAIAGFSAEEMLRPGVDGVMSIKDVLVHITWYEAQMVGMIHQMALRGSPWWFLSLDERNEKIWQEAQSKDLAQACKESEETFRQLTDALQSLTTEMLLDAAYFAEMPAEWRPLDVISSNTYEHYPQHLANLERVKHIP